jgi:NAD(P)-dependent dehydrogenase (short-subunit alcohol dehydrogenase family)
VAAKLADMTGRVCVITGATRGIGRATAEGLARLGATLVLVVRRREDGAAVARELRHAHAAPPAEVVPADLASQHSIREAAETIRAHHPALHVLINNAGTIPKERETTVDGLEMQLAVNHLA